MKTASAIAIALLAGIGIGAFGVHTIHAQNDSGQRATK
jgi:uncharacterized membrane protein YgdD (TMEM256/DUF423 family)